MNRRVSADTDRYRRIIHELIFIIRVYARTVDNLVYNETVPVSFHYKCHSTLSFVFNEIHVSESPKVRQCQMYDNWFVNHTRLLRDAHVNAFF